MSKNGFTTFQTQLIDEVIICIKYRLNITAACVIVGIIHDVKASYVEDTYNSYVKMQRVLA